MKLFWVQEWTTTCTNVNLCKLCAILIITSKSHKSRVQWMFRIENCLFEGSPLAKQTCHNVLVMTKRWPKVGKTTNDKLRVRWRIMDIQHLLEIALRSTFFTVIRASMMTIPWSIIYCICWMKMMITATETVMTENDPRKVCSTEITCN